LLVRRHGPQAEAAAAEQADRTDASDRKAKAMWDLIIAAIRELQRSKSGSRRP